MRQANLLLLGCFCLLAACARQPAGAPPDPAAAEQGVREFIGHVAQTFNGGDFDAFMSVFTDDAIQANHGQADVVGKPAIRAMYEGALAENDIKVEFDTDEVVVVDDLAYERGTYTLHITRRADGVKLGDITNRHIHILRRQPDGAWKTWRMMTNSAAAP